MIESLRATTRFRVAAVFLLTALAFHAVPETSDPSDPRDLETFMDDYLTTRMSEFNIAGAAVAVVKGGRVQLCKGYGFSDVENGIPVDPEKTVFILGSLSKLFTWTAVMRLVEQGRLDLDADINTYLDFRIPDSFSAPITLRHLMSHTSGFDDDKFAQMAVSPDSLVPLGEWLASHMPARSHPAGRYIAYGNYGSALAGYIVERVSGMSYDVYVDRNILDPIGMKDTSSRQPGPSLLYNRLSRCYTFENGVFRPQPVLAAVAPNVGPAASFKSTAADMARFMIAHLNGETNGEPAILQPVSARLMHRRSFSPDPRMNGMAHGFWELDMNGVRIIGHAGSHFVFNSFLMLFPGQDLGVFIITNSREGGAFLTENFPIFQRAFVDRFFPRNAPAREYGAGSPPDEFAGDYHLTYNRSERTPEKFLAMFRSINVGKSEDALLVSLPSGIARFVETEPDVFRHENGDASLIFSRDSDGRITGASYSEIPITAMIRSGWYETPRFNLALIGVCLLLFVSYPAGNVVSYAVRRSRSDRMPQPRFDRAARLAGSAAAILNLIILFFVIRSLFDAYGLYTGNLPFWAPVPVLSVVSVILTSAVVCLAVIAWIRGFWNIRKRILYSLFSLGTVGFVWFMYVWNILGGGF